MKWRNSWLLKEWNTEDVGKFNKLPDEDEALLDPTKVTIITRDGDWFVPACVVARYLRKKGIQVEKTGNYTLFFLFSIGITKGKSGTLITALLDFTKEYFRIDEKTGISKCKIDRENLRRKKEELENMEKYNEKEPPDLKKKKVMLENEIKEIGGRIGPLPEEAENISKNFIELHEEFPQETELRPSKVYERVVKKELEKVPFDNSKGRTSAFMIVPYPPGIPVIMPGQKIEDSAIKYLKAIAEFNRDYPEYATEVHGLPYEKEHIYEGIYVLMEHNNE
jgi:arginine decarboxylase